MAFESREIAPGSPYPRRAYAFFVIAVMMVATCHSQLDKQFPGLLVGPIRAAFHISDTQVSLFQGASFAIFYAVMGPIFGRMVDTRSRRNLIIFGILLWSIMTILAGFSRNYWELLGTRVGVGIGEAVLMPAAFSMIADYVEPAIRGRATAVYMTSQALGTGISLLIGGAIVGVVANTGIFAGLPVLSALAPWQLAFVLVGIPGVITALLMFMVREPLRRGDNIKFDKARGISAEFVGYIKRHKLAVGGVLVSQVAVNFVGNSVVPWLPTIFIRVYKVPVAQLGAILGLILFTGSATGFILSGYLSDRWLKKGRADARLLPLFVGYIAFIPCVIIWPLAGNLYVSYAVFWLQCVAHVMAIATMPMAMQEIVPARMRGQSVTLVILVTTLLGWAVGPTAVALCTDYIFHNDAAVPYSLVLVCVPMAIFALLTAWLGRRAFIATRTELQDAMQAG